MVIWAAMVWISGMQVKHLLWVSAGGNSRCRRRVPVSRTIPARPRLDLPVPRPECQLWRDVQRAAGADRHRFRRLLGLGIWSRHADPVALPESAPHRLYLLGDLGRVWLDRRGILVIAILAFIIWRCLRAAQTSRRCGRFDDRLRCCHPDLLPGRGQYRREPEPNPCFRSAAPVHQLWRQRT